jgi:hypothetical protein
MWIVDVVEHVDLCLGRLVFPPNPCTPAPFLLEPSAIGLDRKRCIDTARKCRQFPEVVPRMVPFEARIFRLCETANPVHTWIRTKFI